MEFDSTVPDASRLDESQLRDIYESAEIDRFLRIFSTHVTEVKTSDIPSANTQLWTDGTAKNGVGASTNQSLSSRIAEGYVSPLLPLQHREIAPFTLARVRLTLNRLYIIAQMYWPYAKTTIDLAQWDDFVTSSFACAAYWILWWNNALLPSFICLLLLALLRRGLMPYPNLEDLREYDHRISQANKFSDRVSDGISPSSTLDLKEIFRLYRLAHSDWKHRSKTTATEDKKIPTPIQASDNQEGIQEEPLLEGDDATILDDPEETKETLEIRRFLLQIFIEVADFNERLRNVFIWRNPYMSRILSAVLFLLFMMTALVPTQYLAKGAWFGIGFAFWHITPVLCALSTDDLSRVPSPLANVPTDAEYAMELISDRVAKGQNIHSLHRHAHQKPRSVDEELVFSAGAEAEAEGSKQPGKGKLKAFGSFVGNESLRVAKEALKIPALASSPLLSGVASVMNPQAGADVQTFMGQRGSSSPGLITLTKERLIFSPVISSQAKVEIEVGLITGVKKIGVFKGLQVSYRNPDSSLDAEERFLWISKRDELFASLVGFGKKKWKNV